MNEYANEFKLENSYIRKFAMGGIYDQLSVVRHEL
jgi:hypothetical protein